MDFVNADVSKIEKEILQLYENIAQKKLYPGDPVRLILESVAYVACLLKNDINWTGSQNLLAYASGEYLDALGDLLGVKRLKPKSAVCILKFSTSQPYEFDVVIPKGTRATPDGKIFFATQEEAVIATGNTSVEVLASCETVGKVGNGFAIGQINQLADNVPYVESVENTSVSYGGFDKEDDEHFRERIRLAPEMFSNAGSKGAYIYHTKSAHQSIEDVSVVSPAPGQVKILFLLENGELPDAGMIQLVSDFLSDEKVRPLTDQVFVQAPNVVTYDINFTYYIHKDYASLYSQISKKVQDAVNDFVLFEKTKIGRDILPEELIKRLKDIQGVYRVELSSPLYQQINEEQVAVAQNITINYGGIVSD